MITIEWVTTKNILFCYIVHEDASYLSICIHVSPRIWKKCSKCKMEQKFEMKLSLVGMQVFFENPL